MDNLSAAIKNAELIENLNQQQQMNMNHNKNNNNQIISQQYQDDVLAMQEKTLALLKNKK